jgi:uncharacterized FlgJ-related protein
MAAPSFSRTLGQRLALTLLAGLMAILSASANTASARKPAKRPLQVTQKSAQISGQTRGQISGQISGQIRGHPTAQKASAKPANRPAQQTTHTLVQGQAHRPIAQKKPKKDHQKIALSTGRRPIQGSAVGSPHSLQNGPKMPPRELLNGQLIARYRLWSKRNPGLNRDKKQFVWMIVRAMHLENLRVRSLHNQVHQIILSGAGRKALPAAVRNKISPWMQEFQAGSMADLLMRLDAIPLSLAVAQAIEESAWGRSKMAKGHNYFGLSKRASGRRKGQIFPSAGQGVAAYGVTLNRHRGYAKLRKLRASMRHSGRLVTGPDLVCCLGAYCPMAGYGPRLCRIIRRLDLGILDLKYP